MANEVEIKVKSTDQTDFASIKRKTKAEAGKTGDEAGKEFGTRLKGWFTRSGNDSSKGFGSSVKKWFAGDGSKLFGQGGQIGGEAFKNGLGGILKTPVIGPLVSAALLGAVAVAAPAAGAIAGAGIVAGFGAGLAGLGIMFAAKNQAVKDVWSKDLKDMGADMQFLARPFEGTLIRMSGTFRRTVDAFNPTLSKVFSKLSWPISDFADEAGQAFQELIPALDPVSDAFTGVLKSLGPAMKSALKSTSEGMQDLARSVAANPEALADTVRGIGDTVKTTLQLVRTLNDANTKFEQLTGGTSMVDVVMKGLQATMAPLIMTFDGLNKSLDVMNALTHSADASGASMSAAANQTALLAQGIDKAGGAAQHAAGPTKTLADKVAAAKQAAADAKAKFEDFIGSLFKLQNQTLSMSGAQIGLQSALDNATKSFKDNGKNLDINTEKGRANQQALNDVAKAANDQTETMLRNGKSQLKTAQAAAATRDNFVRLAMQMGATKPQAEAMAKSMIAIPNVSREAKLKANKADLDAKLAAAEKQLASKNLTKERKAKLNAEISALQSQIRKAQASIDGLRGKTITIGMRINAANIGAAVQDRLDRMGAGNWHGGPVMRGFASGGTPQSSSKEFLAGEYGPEVVSISGGSAARVTPHGDSMRRLDQVARGGGSQHVVLEVRAGDDGAFTDFLIKLLAKGLKTRGGNVQLILGGKAVIA